MSAPLFLFYQEPDPDRWFPGDRFPRRVIRRMFRGPQRPGGVMRWFLNLQAGLDELGVPYRLNDYRGLNRHPGAWAHVIGKPHVIDRISPGHPIIFGPGVAAHPLDNDFWQRPDLRLLLISCEWFKAMYDRDLPRPIPTAVWPAGVDTERWSPPRTPRNPQAVLVYDKIRWERNRYEPELLNPILSHLRHQGFTVHHLRYGSYLEEDYERLLQEVGQMVFLCEHETQGFAYLQALSTGVPLLAWNRGGEWRDPAHYPHNVRFGPVSSVPYWDDRCGVQFHTFADFETTHQQYCHCLSTFRPRDYVIERFRLDECARRYLDITRDFIGQNS